MMRCNAPGSNYEPEFYVMVDILQLPELFHRILML